MIFSTDVTGWVDVIDDGYFLVSRLKTLEYLLLNCAFDIPLTGSRFKGNTKDGYDGGEMLFFLDESLTDLIKEYEGRIVKYEAMLAKGCKGGHSNTAAKNRSRALTDAAVDKAAKTAMSLYTISQSATQRQRLSITESV